MIYEPMPDMRECTMCGQRFPATRKHFYRCLGCKDNLDSKCRECNKKAVAARTKKNPEQKRVRERRRYEKHREKILARQRRHYRTEEGKAVAEKKWRKRYALKRGAEGQYTKEDVERQYARQKGRCYYCSKGVGGQFHVDHVIPLSRDGSNDPSNLVITCADCNLKKNDKLPHEWPEGGRLC